MTDLRDEVARAIEPNSWKPGRETSLAHKNRRTSSQRKADAILALPEIAKAADALTRKDEEIAGLVRAMESSATILELSDDPNNRQMAIRLLREALSHRGGV